MSPSDLPELPPSADRTDLADAFDAVARSYYGRLVSSVYLIVRDPVVAEDLVQDALLAAWRQRQTIDVPAGLPAYLFQASRNRALNHLRNRRRLERTISPETTDGVQVAHQDPGADAQLVAAELQRALERALATLAPGAREVFLLSRQRGLTYGEIAQALGISVKTVETQMGRALRGLRDRLRSWRE